MNVAILLPKFFLQLWQIEADSLSVLRIVMGDGIGVSSSLESLDITKIVKLK